MRTTLSRSAHDGQLVAEVSEVRCCQDLSPCARCLARGDEVGAARRDALIHSVASVRPRRAVLTKRRSGTGYDPGNVAPHAPRPEPRGHFWFALGVHSGRSHREPYPRDPRAGHLGSRHPGDRVNPKFDVITKHGETLPVSGCLDPYLKDDA